MHRKVAPTCARKFVCHFGLGGGEEKKVNITRLKRMYNLINKKQYKRD